MNRLRQFGNNQVVFLLAVLFVGFHFVSTIASFFSMAGLFAADEAKHVADGPAVAGSSSVVSAEQMSAIEYGVNFTPDDWPDSIKVPKLDLSLPIAGSLPEENHWPVTSDTAHFAINSAIPNGKVGNTVLFGHDTPAMFGRLGTLVAGDEIIVDTYDTHHLFKVVGLTISQVESKAFLVQQLEPTLTIVSAPAWESSSKLVITAKLHHTQSITR